MLPLLRLQAWPRAPRAPSTLGFPHIGLGLRGASLHQYSQVAPGLSGTGRKLYFAALQRKYN